MTNQFLKVVLNMNQEEAVLDYTLRYVLKSFESEVADYIEPESHICCLIDMGKLFERYDVNGLDKYRGVTILVPLRKAWEGEAGVEVDTQRFKTYRQLDSGIAVPESVAQKITLRHKAYEPRDMMIQY